MLQTTHDGNAFARVRMVRVSVQPQTTVPGQYLAVSKGTMSEAELHILKARMLEGRRAKARRGELGKAIPMGICGGRRGKPSWIRTNRRKRRSGWYSNCSIGFAQLGR